MIFLIQNIQCVYEKHFMIYIELVIDQITHIWTHSFVNGFQFHFVIIQNKLDIIKCKSVEHVWKRMPDSHNLNSFLIDKYWIKKHFRNVILFQYLMKRLIHFKLIFVFNTTYFLSIAWEAMMTKVNHKSSYSIQYLFACKLSYLMLSLHFQCIFLQLKSKDKMVNNIKRIWCLIRLR